MARVSFVVPQRGKISSAGRLSVWLVGNGSLGGARKGNPSLEPWQDLHTFASRSCCAVTGLVGIISLF